MVSFSNSVAAPVKVFGGTPLPRTVRANPPASVSVRSPLMCTSRPKRARSNCEISPMEMPLSETSSLMMSAQAPVKPNAAEELRVAS